MIRTVTVSAAAADPLRARLNTADAPSLTAASAAATVTALRSWSAITSSAATGATTSGRPAGTVADTASTLSAAARPSFTAVMVTPPVLAVSPAAKVSVPFPLSVKSPRAAGAVGVTLTAMVSLVVSALDSVAVTPASPPSSPIAGGVTVSASTAAPVGVARGWSGAGSPAPAAFTARNWNT